MHALIRFVALALAVVLLLAGCGAAADLGKADAAVDDFHRLLDEERYDDLYDHGSKALHEAASKKDFVALASAVHRKLGRVTSTSRTNWKSYVGTGGSTLTVSYDTVFADGKGAERFVFLADGDRLLLNGYFINSNDLIVK